MEISTFRSVQEFFYEAISAALKRQQVTASPSTEFYLVNLLSGFAHAPLDDEPLALRLQRARDALPIERAAQLRDVGDQSLYVSGFFAESLERRLVDVGYYIRMGETAYGQLASMSVIARTAVEVYRELAAGFARFVAVLAEVADSTALGSDRGVVQLYERWLRTGSESAERRLRARGLVPRRGDPQ